MRIVITAILCVFSLQSLSKDLSATCNNGLIVDSIINDQVTTFSFSDNFQINNKLPIVLASIRVTNHTNTDQLFTTKMLTAKFNDLEFIRAYKNTIASEVIDFSGVTVSSSSQILVNVYWAPQLKIDDKIHSVEVLCGKFT